MKILRTSSGTLRYLDFAGDGRPLVMIHGLGCAGSFEYPHVATAPALRGRRVLVPDLLGYGYSDRPSDIGYTTTDHARVLCELVAEFPEVDLYGHSMGGSIAIELASMLGDRVVNLVLSEANLDSGGGEFSTGIAATGRETYTQSHARLVSKALRSDDGSWGATMRAALPDAVFGGAKSLVDGVVPEWRDQFVSHPASKAFIFGSRNLPDPDADRLAAAGITVLTVPDAGHNMSVQNPEGLASAIAAACA